MSDDRTSPATMLRGVLAVITGLLLISVLVEAIEFGLVTAINGGITTDPVVYFGIRNRPSFLALKLVYNTAVAVLGGYVAAWILGHSERMAGLALAAVQTLSFGWALLNPDLRQWSPIWLWIALIAVSVFGILQGARLREAKVSGAR